ncbi:hypothetical protein_gp024 [Bacillus phage vB_BceM_WH1]|nr:hypothetical protein_gp024 [Bacillus phage vB_BceM_WH1]
MKVIKEVWYSIYEGQFATFTYDSYEALATDTKGYVIVEEETPDVGERDVYESYDEAVYMLALETGGVAIGQDYVVICHDGEELVYWGKEEWEADPSILPSIVNAVKLYYDKGPEYISLLLHS